MEAQVVNLLRRVATGDHPLDALDVLHQLVMDDPMALSVLVRAGGLTTLVQKQEQRPEAVATIIVCASEEYAHEVTLAAGQALRQFLGLNASSCPLIRLCERMHCPFCYS